MILPRDFSLASLNDSKLLSARRRVALLDSIRKCAEAVGVGQVEVADIVRLNILLGGNIGATARSRGAHAVARPGAGRRQAAARGTQAAADAGGRRRPVATSIAAASIIAKVSRDRMVEKLCEVHPGYGFEQHTGYGTLRHLVALAQLDHWWFIGTRSYP